MSEGTLSWESRDDRTFLMTLAPGGSEWLEVRRMKGDAASGWRIEGRLNGTHYKLGDVYPTREAAQGGALLLAMRLVPGRRDALLPALGALPGAWWWKITPFDDATGRRSIFGSSVSDSEASAERSGRAAGAGWRLEVYGPGGSVRECGFVQR